ncbi:hypothetical protein F4808DRAFT_418323 [Astrocystis sublimbata]|nr:hypothetical protein F4808DRAFT_418323 [Astrocystis sublimbata]
MWTPDEGTPKTMTIIIIVFLVLNSVSVALRCFVRAHMNNAFSYDDWAMIASLIGFYGMSATILSALIHGYAATGLPQPTYDPLRAAQSIFAFQLVYIVSAYLCKVSVALVLLRISAADKKSLIRKLLFGCMAIVTAFAIATFIVIVGQCRPVSLNWGVGEGECIPTFIFTNIAYAFSASDIASNWFFATLPIFLLWNVQLSFRVKLSVVLLLGFSFTSSIATVVRLKYVVDFTTISATPTDPKLAFILLDATIWSVLEIGLAIFAASLSALRPLLKFITGRGDSSAGKSNSAWSKALSRSKKNTAIQLDEMPDNRFPNDGNDTQFPDNGSSDFILHTGDDQFRAARDDNVIYKTTKVEIRHQAR